MSEEAKVSSLSKLLPAENRIGSSVDKYTIVRLLGRGGMGAVYEARHAKLARRFAIKFLLAEFAANRDVLRRFENEAKAAGGLEHPNLAAVTDVGQTADGAPYLVMEFLEGQDASRLLRSYGPLPVRRAADIVQQACRGLAVAHRAGIVHRDLKPANLFIADAGDGTDHVKVLDFGIAKLRSTDASVATGTGATFGTAFYMSPEQARGAGDVDHRADVWSLGVLLYELLSGQMPFQGEAFLEVIHKILSTEPRPLSEARPGLPPALVALVHQTLRKELLERPPSVVALAEALAPFVDGASASRPGGLYGRLAGGLDSTRPAAETQASPVSGVGMPRELASSAGGTGRAESSGGGRRVSGGLRGAGDAPETRRTGHEEDAGGAPARSGAPGTPSQPLGAGLSYGSSSSSPSSPPSARRGRALLWLGAGLGVALVAAGAFLAFRVASKTPEPSTKVAPVVAPGGLPSVPPSPAASSPVPSASASSPPPAQPAPSPSQAAALDPRTVSEQFERRPSGGANSHRTPRDSAREAKRGPEDVNTTGASLASRSPASAPSPSLTPAPTAPIVPALSPLPAAQAPSAQPPTRPSGHPIEIERDNPYGN